MKLDINNLNIYEEDKSSTPFSKEDRKLKKKLKRAKIKRNFNKE